MTELEKALEELGRLRRELAQFQLEEVLRALYGALARGTRPQELIDLLWRLGHQDCVCDACPTCTMDARYCPCVEAEAPTITETERRPW